MKHCPKCHQTYADDSLNFCLTDGEVLKSGVVLSNLTTTAVYSQPKKKSGRRALFSLAVVLVILGLSAGSYLYFFGSQANSRGSETNQTSAKINTQPTLTPQPSVAQTPETQTAASSTQSPSPNPSETSNTAPDATPSPSSTPSSTNVKSKVESQFFTFELKQCRLSGTSVACDLLITNTDRDRRLTLRSNSTTFDQEGNQYRAGKMQLANQEDYGVSSYLISSVATKARVTFDAVSPTATKLTLLYLSCSVQDGPDFNVEYRNVPLK